MQLSQIENYNLTLGLLRLSDKPMAARTALTLVKNRRAVQGIAETFERDRDAIVKRYSAKDDLPSAEQELGELFQTIVDCDLTSITLEDLPKDMSPAEIEQLLPIIKEYDGTRSENHKTRG